ncbi:SMP-30/gluconolactonase/LRE family protein [Prosthecomicrobium pneumaticum]|uniref:Sugar lactone lactonase YvrE n=1 Tax=Prosthecomicrobium pneumaticum TaxID=81895 RepID=A0A7W9CSW6_9HYPH|nr:SMP-30/gluconolactonase/LRE family protein [Prosthecomicrobium pneumaticum]MBB5751207.1 sugar lactone lactonase YvrE [Prosthecomicrobium pneumaticum]
MAEIAFVPLTPTLHRLAEGPSWDDRRGALLYCDIPEGRIRAVTPDGLEVDLWTLPDIVCSFGLCESGRLVVALRDRVVLFDPSSGGIETLATIEADNPATRLNDGKVGPDGAFWVGTMDESPAKRKVGALYRVTADGSVEKKVEGLGVSNGLAFAADGRTLFHADSRGPWIDRWTLDPATGALSDRVRLAELDEATGRPDGGATDVEGYYWSAGVSAARLNRFAPDGRLVESHSIPAAAPTMPCFGGPDMKTLFVTSLRTGRTEEQLARYPLSGSVFVGRSTVAGVPVGRFRGV